jgi:hypothetical protein
MKLAVGLGDSVTSSPQALVARAMARRATIERRAWLPVALRIGGLLSAQL